MQLSQLRAKEVINNLSGEIKPAIFDEDRKIVTVRNSSSAESEINVPVHCDENYIHICNLHDKESCLGLGDSWKSKELTRASRAPGNSQLHVELYKPEMWKKFCENQTEMVVTRAGRCLFPEFNVSVSGMNPDAFYCIVMDVKSIDDHKWKYQAGRWMVSGRGEPQTRSDYFIHPDSPARGDAWMEELVCFRKMKITNTSKNATSGKFFVHSMQCYQPRVHIVQTGDVRSIQNECWSTFSFKETAFITVTAYQNPLITKLKVDLNPFAKGYRSEGAKSNCERFRSNETRTNNSSLIKAPSDLERFYMGQTANDTSFVGHNGWKRSASSHSHLERMVLASPNSQFSFTGSAAFGAVGSRRNFQGSPYPTVSRGIFHPDFMMHQNEMSALHNSFRFPDIPSNGRQPQITSEAARDARHFHVGLHACPQNGLFQQNTRNRFSSTPPIQPHSFYFNLPPGNLFCTGNPKNANCQASCNSRSLPSTPTIQQDNVDVWNQCSTSQNVTQAATPKGNKAFLQNRYDQQAL